MHFAILGSGGVGGYYGARLIHAGHKVTFIARGAHLRAIRERGLMVWSPLGDFTVRAAAEEDPGKVEGVDVVVVAVKTYDNATALPLIKPMLGESSLVLTLQNGVDSADEVAKAVGDGPVLGGTTYIAVTLVLPGLIEQTGTSRRIVFGEAFGDRSRVSDRVERLREAMARADIQVEAVPDALVPIWEKFVFLAPIAAFTGAARLPVGPLRAEEGFREVLGGACAEVERVARALGVSVQEHVVEETLKYFDAMAAGVRSSLLVDLQQGRRIEVEALLGSVVKRGRAAGVPTPIMSALYSVLKPFEQGTRR
jgi:2-dehydropantoate 2-reductase